MLEPEEVFAEEAQEEARLLEESHRHHAINTQFHVRDEQDEDDNETSPLMSPRQRRKSPATYARDRSSYERAINEPWTGAYGSSDLPWYKKPSVWRLTISISSNADVSRYYGCYPPCFPSPSHSVVSSFPRPTLYLT